jgi:hypothetical protein
VFEIGNSLREARLRQQLDFPELEQQTKIRAKYLKALEAEDFDVLPAPTYVKGFLRNYADALGLEGQLYVDEYNSGSSPVKRTSRFVRATTSAAAATWPAFRSSAPSCSAVGAIAVNAALVIGGWKWGSSNSPQVQGVNSPTPTGAKKRQQKPAQPMAPPRPDGYQRRLLAERARRLGRRGSRSSSGRSRRATARRSNEPPYLFRRLWFTASKPQNLVAKLNGRIVVIPGAAKGKPEQLLVTPTSITKAPPAT